jgi:hypothetical protein
VPPCAHTPKRHTRFATHPAQARLAPPPKKRALSPPRSTARHGISLQTLYRRAAGAPQTLLVVRDGGGHVFGAFSAEAWRVAPRFYGTGETFVFQLEVRGGGEHRPGRNWRTRPRVTLWGRIRPALSRGVCRCFAGAGACKQSCLGGARASPTLALGRPARPDTPPPPAAPPAAASPTAPCGRGGCARP